MFTGFSLGPLVVLMLWLMLWAVDLPKGSQGATRSLGPPFREAEAACRGVVGVAVVVVVVVTRDFGDSGGGPGTGPAQLEAETSRCSSHTQRRSDDTRRSSGAASARRQRAETGAQPPWGFAVHG